MKKSTFYFALAAICTAILLGLLLSSCSTQKNGCGDYSRWEARTKFKG